jgi:hypothetical protein
LRLRKPSQLKHHHTEKVILTMFRKQQRQTTARMLDQATAILEGRVRDLSCQTAEGWIRINQLAHVSWDEVQRLAETRVLGSPWEGAVSYLATEICAQADSAPDLLALQRNGLIPLELNVLAGWTAPPETPLELISLVRVEVDRNRRVAERLSQQPD